MFASILRALIACALVSMIAAPAASADRTFSVRYASTENGSTRIAANTLMTCPGNGSSCSNARAGTNNNDNGDYTMTFVDTDGSAYTSSNSSTADLSLPPSATVRFAGLYWAADTDAGSGGSAAANPAQRNQIDFKTPGALYSTVVASVLDTDSTDSSRYQGFADVTAAVAAAGNGTYSAGDIQAGTGGNRYAGWALVIAYGNTAEPFRRIHVYDGFQMLQNTQTIDISLSDFLTPESGTVNGRMGMVAWEGDRALTGDTAALNGNTLSDALSPANDFFNSSITRDGAQVTTKNPNYVNQLSLDADEISINGLLSNGSSSATWQLGTTGDLYMPGVVTLATDEGPPVNRSAPTISGTTTQGQVLTANPGTWDGTPTLTYAYQWRRCDSSGLNCSNISGQTGTTYTLGAADVGSTIRVAVTVSNAAGSGSATSAQTAVITTLAPVNVIAPSISGPLVDGGTLSATDGTWTGTGPITYAYQWQRCNSGGGGCANIGGATGSTYDLVSGDVGHAFVIVVTATNAGGSTPAPSAPTGEVAAAPPVNVTVPVVSGTEQDGETLSATDGTWTGTDPISYSYQWQRCESDGSNCADIAGETGSTYDLVSGDVGHAFVVVVTATNVAGSASAASDPSGEVAAAPPVNVTVPVVSGTEQDGETLSATDGTWTGTDPISYSYQWQRCDSDGSNCADVAGETNATYDLTGDDVGHAIVVVVTATNVAGSASAASDPSAEVAAAPPVNVTVPVVSGTEQDGETLSATDGTWTGTDPISYSYQWQRCDSDGSNCADVAGETNATYDLTGDDVGHAIVVVVTATNVAGSASAASDPSAEVAAAPPVNVTVPVVSGTEQDGETLSATDGTWTGTDPISYSYQWQRCDSDGSNCADVTGETDATYDLTGDDAGHAIVVVVTATNVAGSASAASDPSGEIAGLPPVNTGLPVVSGTEQDGETLSATDGTWTGTDPISYSYQWQRCDSDGSNCADVAGETNATYDLTGDDVGHAIVVVVTATNVAGSASAASDPTGEIVAAPPVNVAPPAISGTPIDGSTLTADDGTWTGTEPITYAYQWQRCDADGSNCVDIPGATDSTYDLTGDDVGHSVRVVVTATNAVGSAGMASASTAAVTAATPPTTPPAETPAATPPTADASTPVAPTPAAAPDGVNAAGRCVMLAGGVGYRRIEVKGSGSVRQRIRVTDAASAQERWLVTVDAKRLRSVRYTLDGRPMKASRSRYALKLVPADIKPGTHKLVTTIKPRKGKTRKFTFRLRAVPCTTVLSASQWRTHGGSGLRLRVESRTAVKGVSFTVPAVLARKLATGRPASSLRVNLEGRKRLTVKLKAGAGKTAAGASVRVKGRTVRVSGLPDAARIVTMTLYQPRAPKGPALLKRGRSVRVTATVETDKKQKLSVLIRGTAG